MREDHDGGDCEKKIKIVNWVRRLATTLMTLVTIVSMIAMLGIVSVRVAMMMTLAATVASCQQSFTSYRDAPCIIRGMYLCSIFKIDFFTVHCVYLYQHVLCVLYFLYLVSLVQFNEAVEKGNNTSPVEAKTPLSFLQTVSTCNQGFS